MRAIMKSVPHKQLGKSEGGFSLSELMIAITIGLLILAGLTVLFTNTSKSRGEVDRVNRQVENGRYAIQVLMEDLKIAGYLAEFDPTNLPTPATMPDPCATAAADLRTAMPLHVQGYDNGNGVPTCLQDVRSGTDILVMRRASTCVAGDPAYPDCDPVTSGYPYFQASLCYPSMGATELASGNINNFYALDTNAGGLTLRKKDCTTTASLRRYLTHIYFVANNNNASDGIPTLKRAELANGQFTIVPLVEGIENLQLEYGLDTDASGAPTAGSPKAYTTDPGSFNACAASACVDNWRRVVTVKAHVLARNTEKTTGYSDTKTYTLGLNSIGANNTFGPFNDAYKRHVYQSSIRLNNPAGRREP